MAHALALDVAQLRVMRGRQEVLKAISFEVAPGELVGLLGPSGSGKSTLMRTLMGVQSVTSGTARALGERVGTASLRRRIGYMAQGSAIYPDLTVLENLTYFSGVLGLASTEAARVMDVVDLHLHAQQLVASLSGGERSRVSLAVALLGDPPLLILDEPTVGLDPVLREDLWTTFARVVDSGATALVSSHVMDEAARCGRLLLIREGRLLFDDTPAALIRRTAASGYDEAFVRLIKEAP